MNNITNFKRPQEFIEKNCLTCNGIFEISKHSKKEHLRKFCSRSCGAIHNNKKRIYSNEWKNKIKNSILNKIKTHGYWGSVKPPLPPKEKKCIECDNIFISKKRKTCSNHCYIKHRNKNIPKTSGGYRIGSGRSKHGYYKGIYCGSTYELCWVIYNLDHGIKFERFPTFLEKNGLKYYPDFLLDDKKTIIEIKGYESKESVNKKTKLAESFGYIVKVLRKNDLKYVFDYVKEKYNTSNFASLYDEYKPKYDYICTNCKNTFSKDRKLKTKNVFCCVKCSGHFNGTKRTAPLVFETSLKD